MSDLIERLRRWKHGAGCGCTRCAAANEIERLNGAVSGLRQNRDMANARIEKLERNIDMALRRCDSGESTADIGAALERE